jgi:hypothetical protein
MLGRNWTYQRRLCQRVTCAALLVCLLTVTGSAESRDFAERISPRLRQITTGSQTMIPVVAFMESSPIRYHKSVSPLLKVARSRSGHAQLLSQLSKSSSTADFCEFLNELVRTNEVKDVRSFWIADVVAFSVLPEAIPEIAAFPGLHYLVEDQPLELVAPVSMLASESGYAGSSNSMTVTGVRDLWQRGYTGRGRLVCSFDTGVEGDHPALAASWLGNNGGTSAQSWFDPFGTTSPVDTRGHGTHTMGIMLGRDGADTIGVAFNADWISASVIDRGQSLSKTISDIIGAFQWAADPDGNPNTVDDVPDVVCNSWGIPKGLLAPCDETFWQAIDNLEALGVVCVFACGNEGPNPQTIRTPADRASTPLNAFSIGAVDQNQIDLPIAEFSSRGPANCDEDQIKPELVAPGVSIRSSYKDGGYKVMSGTSMAAPFVAGCIALMREYNPDATVNEIKNALVMSARDLGPVGEDNDYGYGFIDVAEAVEYLPTPQKPNLSIESIQIAGGTSGIMPPGNTTQLELVVRNRFAPVIDLTAIMRPLNPYASVLLDTAFFGAAAAGESLNNEGAPFLVKLDHATPYGIPIGFAIDFYTPQHGFVNTSELTVFAGESVAASQINLETSKLSYQVSNFGISRSLYSFERSERVLSLLSLIIADESGTVYDGLPGNLDFAAISNEDAGGEITSKYSTYDGRFRIEQRTSVHDETGDDDFVVLNYEISQPSGELAQNLQLGLAADADFTAGESLLLDGGDFIFKSSVDGGYVGIRFLSSGTVMGTEVSGLQLKDGDLTEFDKYELMLAGSGTITGEIGDAALVADLGERSITPETPLQFAAVLALGNSRDSVIAALSRGERYNDQVTSVADNGTNLPTSFRLEQNYPNPFNSETIIEFTLPRSGSYDFDIYNVMGQRILHKRVENATAGRQIIGWNGADEAGRPVATGVYFYRITFSGNSQTRKMVLLK